MHGFPIVDEFGLGHIAPDDETDRGAAIAERRARLHPTSWHRHDQNSSRCDRELSEIDRDGFRRCREPVHKRASRQGDLAWSERDIEHATADFDRRRRQPIERIVGKVLADELRLGASGCANKHPNQQDKQPGERFHQG